jgi:hypothetical protein
MMGVRPKVSTDPATILVQYDLHHSRVPAGRSPAHASPVDSGRRAPRQGRGWVDFGAGPSELNGGTLF